MSITKRNLIVLGSLCFALLFLSSAYLNDSFVWTGLYIVYALVSIASAIRPKVAISYYDKLNSEHIALFSQHNVVYLVGVTALVMVMVISSI